VAALAGNFDLRAVAVAIASSDRPCCAWILASSRYAPGAAGLVAWSRTIVCRSAAAWSYKRWSAFPRAVVISNSPGSSFSGDSLGSTGTIALSATGSAAGFFAAAAFFDAEGLSVLTEPGPLGAAAPPAAGVVALDGGTGVAGGAVAAGGADASPEAGVGPASAGTGGGVSGDGAGTGGGVTGAAAVAAGASGVR